jgi:hypothetical protein
MGGLIEMLGGQLTGHPIGARWGMNRKPARILPPNQIGNRTEGPWCRSGQLMAATTLFRFREHWRELRRGRPGHRFQARYERARREESQCGPGQRIVFFILAFIFIAVGAVLVVIPGPAIPFFFIAGGLLATESRYIARLMDWIEVRARKIVAWARQRWRRLPKPVRAVLIVLGICCSAGSAYLSYRFLRD